MAIDQEREAEEAFQRQNGDILVVQQGTSSSAINAADRVDFLSLWLLRSGAVEEKALVAMNRKFNLLAEQNKQETKPLWNNEDNKTAPPQSLSGQHVPQCTRTVPIWMIRARLRYWQLVKQGDSEVEWNLLCEQMRHQTAL